MAHYAVQLKENITKLEANAKEAQETIIAFRSHLLSSKFSQDTTIQVSDVQRWLDYIREALEGNT